MKFKFGFTPKDNMHGGATEEPRESRKSAWLKRCISVNLGDNFPDGAASVEGGIFIRNSETTTNMVAAVPNTIQPNNVVEIKKPTSKRLHNWLNYFYPLSPQRNVPGSVFANISPATSTIGSDIEADPIMHRFSPPPRKSILKRPSPQLDTMAMETVNDTLVHRSPSPSESVKSQAKKTLVFKETTYVVETYGRDEYNRSAIDYIARALTPTIAMLIKKELNEVKTDMEVHEDSRHHTQFYTVH